MPSASRWSWPTTSSIARRAHARGERRVGRRAPVCRRALLGAGVEQLVHAGIIAPRRPRTIRRCARRNATTDLQAEAVDLLARLLRIDTVNPPGDELPAQELLAALLRDAGFEVTLVGRTPSRPNLVARLRGEDDGPTLCLLSHVDTVLAHAAEWQRDPWGGEVVDGVVWGRGALDMKNQTAAEVVAAVSLAREGWRPARGDCSSSSSSTRRPAATDGAIWLCDNHPDSSAATSSSTRARAPSSRSRTSASTASASPRRASSASTSTTSGVAGHASNPRMGDNALLKLAPLLDAMGDAPAGLRRHRRPLRLLRDLGLDGPAIRAPRSSSCGRATRCWRCWSSRSSA